MSQRREFVACVEPAEGGTMTVTITAYTAEEATRKLVRMGYRVISVS